MEEHNSDETANSDQMAPGVATDCRTEDGLSVGLVDAIITLFRALRPRIVEPPPAAAEALKDLRQDEDAIAAMGFPGDAAELAWGLIANAYGGDWDEATEEWQQAAVRWRDSFLGPRTIPGMDPNIRKDTPITPPKER